MSSVLIVEDEPVLRAAMARGLARALDVDVHEAGTVDEAIAKIDASPPGCIVSDIDLPGRTGLELVGELGRRRLDVPLLFVSAYLKTYRAQIPPNARVEILEKPVPLEQLRAWVAARIKERPRSKAPFGVTDYVQLACMGNHSVEILLTWQPSGAGRIVVSQGTIWSAQDAGGGGLAAFRRLAFRRGTVIDCRALEGEPGPRDVDEPWEMVLIESARLVDEEARQAAHAPPPAEPAPEAPPPPPPNSGETTFEDLWDAGVEALLARDYLAAQRAFLAARDLRPSDGRVLANLKRLEELGYPEPSSSEGGG